MYLLSLVPETYKGLDLPEGESYAAHNCLRWAGMPKLDLWKPPSLVWFKDEYTSDDSPIADFVAFAGGQIALSDNAYLSLKDTLGNQAEFLPTIGPEPEHKWRLLNVVNVLDIMDGSKSKYEIYSTGKVGECSHAFLNPPEDGNRIFKVKGYFPFIFIDEKTKNMIESAGLTGTLIRKYLNP